MLWEPTFLSGKFCDSARFAEELWRQQPGYRHSLKQGGSNAQDRRSVFRGR